MARRSERIYICNKCGYVSSTQKGLNIHKSKAHKIPVGQIVLIIGVVISFISFIVTNIIAIHQLVQPLVFSRIESFEILPLYVQSNVEGGGRGEEAVPLKTDYFRYFQIKYYIEPNLLTKSNISIKIPKNTELLGPITGFTENNPYIEIVEDDFKKRAFYSSDDFEEIELNIKTEGLYIKKIPFVLYFRERVDLKCSYLGSSDDIPMGVNTQPEKIPKIVCNSQKIGYGKIKDNNIIFRFDEFIITNRGDLEIRGFVEKIGTGDVQTRACENGKEFITMESIANNVISHYVSVDLKPGESRRIIVLQQRPELFETDFENFYSGSPHFYFKNSGCLGDWNNFIS